MSDNNHEFTGTIKQIFEINQVSDTFTKQEFLVCDDDPKYPQTVKFECTQSRCDQLVGKKVGENVTVKFNIRGSEWKEKHYVSLQAWNITVNLEASLAKVETIDDSTLPF